MMSVRISETLGKPRGISIIACCLWDWYGDVDARTEHRDRAALRCECALMRRRVDAARAAAYDRHAYVSQLISEFARDLQAVVRGLSRTHHGNRILFFAGQVAFDVKHDGRIVNLTQDGR